METSKSSADERRVRLAAQEQAQSSVQKPGQATVDPAPFRGQSISQLPSGPGTRALRQKAVLQMQRTHGNGMVMRQLDTIAQREDAPQPAAAEGGAPSEISGGGSYVKAADSGIEVTGPAVNLKSATVQADGVIRATTIMADTVVASSYTPGAGNLM